MLSFNFEGIFGAEYKTFDDAFSELGRGLSEYERFLITLERIQGALLAEDFVAMALQIEAAESMLGDIEDYFGSASVLFASIQNDFQDTDPELSQLAAELSLLSSASRTSAIFQPVPEPSSAVLSVMAGLGLIGLAIRRRRAVK